MGFMIISYLVTGYKSTTRYKDSIHGHVNKTVCGQQTIRYKEPEYKVSNLIN